ncbi:MAG: helix-turn-helix transcriptional regulator, partial [Pusillimonas sp.]
VAGVTQPSHSRLMKVAEFFNVSLHELTVEKPRQLARRAESDLVQALMHNGWQVEEGRRNTALPDIFVTEGYTPDLCARKDGYTLYMEVRAAQAGRSAHRINRYCEWLAERAGNLLVVYPQAQIDIVEQAEQWLRAQKIKADAPPSAHVPLLDLVMDVNLSSGAGQMPPMVSGIDLDAQQALMLFGRQNVESVRLWVAQGDAMAPTIAPRELLFIDTQTKSFAGDGIYAIVMHEAVAIKRLQRLDAQRLMVKSDNPAYESVQIDPQNEGQVRVIGRVLCALPLAFRVFA